MGRMKFNKTSVFDSFSAIIYEMDTEPDDWRQHRDILESWISKSTYCKIWTLDGMLAYVIAVPEGIYFPTLWEKYKLWKAIGRYRKYIIKSLLEFEEDRPTRNKFP